jgi:tetrahydromethanopterin:alpha-L-glutamate ligase
MTRAWPRGSAGGGPPRIAVFTDDPGWHGARLAEAFGERGCETVEVSLAECRLDCSEGSPGLAIPGFDRLPEAAFVRGVPGGSLEEVVLHLDILHALDRLEVTVYNPGHAIERSVDKGMSSFLLHRAAIATPPAWVVRDPGAAERLAQRELTLGHELVQKPLFGSQGNGLVRIGAVSDLLQPADCNGVYYLQRFVDCGSAKAQDFRVFAVRGHAIAAMRRVADNGWISNVAQGATCHPAALEPDLCDLAERAVTALGMRYAGVDVLRDASGRPWVIEVNGVPAWKGLQQVCDIDIAAALVDDCLGLRRGNAKMEAVGR